MSQTKGNYPFPQSPLRSKVWLGTHLTHNMNCGWQTQLCSTLDDHLLDK
jgi:hypothetical protein